MGIGEVLDEVLDKEVDFSAEVEGGNFGPVPKGWYRAYVDGLTAETSKAGESMVSVKFKVDDDDVEEGNGRVHFKRLMLEGKGTGITRKFFTALQVPSFTPSDMMSHYCYIFVADQPGDAAKAEAEGRDVRQDVMNAKPDPDFKPPKSSTRKASGTKKAAAKKSGAKKSAGRSRL